MPTINQVAKAIDNAIRAEPTVNYQICEDASQLANVLGEMIHFKEQERALERFTSTQQAVYKRWEAQ